MHSPSPRSRPRGKMTNARPPSYRKTTADGMSTTERRCYSGFGRRRPMATDVIMPQMGESIAEGTITKWMKKVGDAVKRDEPIFEISTDKVDAEIPSPVAGTLLEIKVPEGQTVAINTVVARIGEASEAGVPAEAAAPKAEASKPPAPAEAAPDGTEAPAPPAPKPQAAPPPPPAEPVSKGSPAPRPSPTPAPSSAAAPTADAVATPGNVESFEERIRTRSS